MKSLFLVATLLIAGQSLLAQKDSVLPNFLLPKLKMKSDGHQTIAPVSILDFKVQRLSKNRVLISWHTEQEQKGGDFGVQRRLDDEGLFKDIGIIQSKSNGDSTLVFDYTFTDVNGFNGRSYYRIKQKNNSGSSFYTPIKTLSGW